ncbi:MAG: hypothetical protein ACYC3Q_10415 [Gemmatimonadaceae bacterium]
MSGSDPLYTVSLYDDYGDDTDDVVLSVRVLTDTCALLAETPNASLLNQLGVQQALKNLWLMSDPSAPVELRREMGGYLVRQGEDVVLVPFQSNSSPDMCTATISGAEISEIQQGGGTIIGFVHTHPFKSGTPVPTSGTGTCKGLTAPGMRFGDGPSQADKDAAMDSPWPSFVVDSQHVHSLPPNYQPGMKIPKFNRNKSCAQG